MEQAKVVALTDITYCVSKTCKDKCWRHEDFNIFYKELNYSFTNRCIKKKMNYRGMDKIAEEICRKE